ncbi:hypothetical protein CAter10_0853 [Collimonas arenae]|uniref:hypothetical protein n=1 Tax=Collimonas arenae TaxID=279058 RepID=UPI0007788321|nr:hypothetical protein [Collimonas arenae]AMO98694.1 hypothetical protein CAter10_0853 [Collimonas arenae]
MFGGLIIISCIFFVFDKFKIFPWDYPLLFTFFKPGNNYSWDYPGSFKYLDVFVLSVIMMGLILSLFNLKIFKKVLFLQIFVICIIGCAQTYNWVSFHTKDKKNIMDYAGAIKTMVSGNDAGKGIFISNDRFGLASYALFGLANSPKVLERALGSTITQTDIAGAEWVLLFGNYSTDFNYRNAIALGSYKFFRLRNKFLLKKKRSQSLR